MYHRIGAAGFAKQTKHRFHCAPHFCIGVRNDAALLVVAIADRERETQFAFFRSRSAIATTRDRKSTRLNSSHITISYAVFCLKKKKKKQKNIYPTEHT